MSRIAAGIDIGGTKIAIGLVDEQGTVLAQSTLKTDLSLTPKEMLGRTASEVRRLAEELGIPHSSLEGVGVGAPGPLNTKEGILTCPPNLKSWWGFPVVAELQELLSLPVKMENDATAATLAEKWVGAAQDSEHFVFITISTGIGAGIYLHGKLITGNTGNTGDAGFMFVHPQGDVVHGEPSGYWEQIASGTAIARAASEMLGRQVSTKEVFDQAAAGDPAMTELTERVYTYIGMGCVSLINLLDPAKIVIGGGVSQVGEPLFSAVRAYVAKHALNPSGRETAIVPAQLQQNAGLIGAAALIQQPY
ncbi:ROK family protein [Paenibacillus sp. J5C_2022]|uniref:ROK family protein n=1 Tax=Paenibacillus sp. J5C2022 TaxID=2977129 RepID=UPI0021CF3E0F|nr:ROK family protein [Paenibacillus sp. J5C2022]MCU6709237.1 ROK family protein [Paenibacillus sp. J5C2022]